MFCINCFQGSTNVINSRSNKKHPQVWRRRKCTVCRHIFTTHERPSLQDNIQINLSDGSCTTFNLGKLILSIAKAFTHAPKDIEANALWLAQTVEETLSTQRQTITPEDIEAATHQVLKRFDELAAMQYAAQHHLISSARKRGRPSLRERVPRTDALPSQ